MSRILPILFNTDMVRAILDGRKTVTRRVIKPQPKMILSFNLAGYGYEKWSYPPPKAYELWGEKYKWPDNITKEDKNLLWTPPCHVDDILYVRETWHKYTKRVGQGQSCHIKEFYGYKASVANSEDAEEKWCPSIHMPKEAARIWLKVTDVWVERLQDITEEQAKAEGVTYEQAGEAGYERWTPSFYDPDSGGEPWYVGAYAWIWNSTIKKPDIDHYRWEANPYVWVIKFERCEKLE